MLVKLHPCQTKTRLPLVLACLALSSIGGINLATAHHGTAINYDWDTTVQLTGTVTEFIWRNPHAALFLDVKGRWHCH